MTNTQKTPLSLTLKEANTSKIYSLSTPSKVKLFASKEVWEVWLEKKHMVSENLYKFGPLHKEYLWYKPFITPEEWKTFSLHIHQDLTGSKAGTCTWRGPDKPMLIRLNVELRKDQIWDILGHELAHALVYHRYYNVELARGLRPWSKIRGSVPPHGSIWKWVSTAITESPPSRCHSYENVKKVRKTKKYVYNVEGKEVHLGATRHNRILKGTYAYMTTCGRDIKKEHFTGKVFVS